ncbi:TusE/DsrC/DsvC family sulfur relay protein [Buchnera aphidicola]|uniref:Sulfurtransferase n=1 Tax=Buchnera aphidicola (Artemisaphis artemisicola) TaxID=1241836 RepID=A0A4D6XIC8_9GAMM|nr:TusE/DsrC/DsvC family sulfur relay protein [Buchnera aphidicola]QCI16262.1 TusE/DsrC/DsvC family sulfur relay protein [Buchnera aphidicola (Artemisaphis artemisicola)]
MNIKNKVSYTYNKIEKDSEGYLKKTQDWNVTLAKEIAKQENINLSPDHWKIIIFVRKFYFKFNITPSMRMLIKSIKKEIKASQINSIYLFKLFPKGPAEQASKIAGIPKPARCL